MGVYLDANVLVALLVSDALTAQAQASVGRLADPVVVSDIAALEFASTVARKVRAGDISLRDGRATLASFDSWIRPANQVETQASDVAAAQDLIRRLDVNLHGVDALHVALVMRLGARLLTLDTKMKASAKKLGVAVI